MFDDDDWDFDFDDVNFNMNKDEDYLFRVLMYVVIIGFCIWFVWAISKPSEQHFKECQESCLKKGAETWNWGRHGCECGGTTKHE